MNTDSHTIRFGERHIVSQARRFTDAATYLSGVARRFTDEEEALFGPGFRLAIHILTVHQDGSVCDDACKAVA